MENVLALGEIIFAVREIVWDLGELIFTQKEIIFTAGAFVFTFWEIVFTIREIESGFGKIESPFIEIVHAPGVIETRSKLIEARVPVISQMKPASHCPSTQSADPQNLPSTASNLAPTGDGPHTFTQFDHSWRGTARSRLRLRAFAAKRPYLGFFDSRGFASFAVRSQTVALRLCVKPPSLNLSETNLSAQVVLEKTAPAHHPHPISFVVISAPVNQPRLPGLLLGKADWVPRFQIFE